MYDYHRVLDSGNILEIWSYEKAPRPHAKPRKRIQKEASSLGDRIASRRRKDNIRRTRQRFVKLVSINCARAGVPALLTLTMRSIVPIETSSKFFAAFFDTLKRTYKIDIEYIGVPEFQKRGAVHYHVLVWGLSEELIYGERASRFLGNIWARGFLDCVPTDGSPKLAGYLSKYMSKAMHDDRLGGKRAFLASRGIMRPVLYKSPLIVAHAREVLGVDIELLTEKKFSTEWLGECHYKRYKTIAL